MQITRSAPESRVGAGQGRIDGPQGLKPSEPAPARHAATRAVFVSNPGRTRVFGNVRFENFPDATPGQYSSAIRASLTPDLLKGRYKREWSADKPKSWGHCYVATEAFYALMGGKAAGWTVNWVKHEGSTHHFLRNPRGEVVDLTADQFKTPVPYEQGKRFGWMTGETPSERAQILLNRVAARLQ